MESWACEKAGTPPYRSYERTKVSDTEESAGRRTNEFADHQDPSYPAQYAAYPKVAPLCQFLLICIGMPLGWSVAVSHSCVVSPVISDPGWFPFRVPPTLCGKFRANDTCSVRAAVGCGLVTTTATFWRPMFLQFMLYPHFLKESGTTTNTSRAPARGTTVAPLVLVATVTRFASSPPLHPSTTAPSLCLDTSSNDTLPPLLSTRVVDRVTELIATVTTPVHPASSVYPPPHTSSADSESPHIDTSAHNSGTPVGVHTLQQAPHDEPWTNPRHSV